MSAVSARIAWKLGGEATIVLLDGDKVELVSTRAWPPGSRPEATLASTGERVWLKVFGSRRDPDGAFRVSGRLLDAKRSLLDAIAGSSGSPSPGTASGG